MPVTSKIGGCRCSGRSWPTSYKQSNVPQTALDFSHSNLVFMPFYLRVKDDCFTISAYGKKAAPLGRCRFRHWRSALRSRSRPNRLICQQRSLARLDSPDFQPRTAGDRRGVRRARGNNRNGPGCGHFCPSFQSSGKAERDEQFCAFKHCLDAADWGGIFFSFRSIHFPLSASIIFSAFNKIEGTTESA